MKKCLLNACAILLTVALYSQSSQVKWSATIAPQKLFIENRSQFDGKNDLPGTGILFGTDEGPGMIYFTKNGLTYRFDNTEKIQHEEKDNDASAAEREEQEHEVKITTDVVQVQWLNANPDVQVEAMDPAASYFNYSVGNKGIDRVKAYHKVVYRELYPHIDVEYVFHPVEGIEYSLILHPGADISQVKMQYSGSQGITVDANGNIHISTLFGDIIDRAPQTGYSETGSSMNKTTIPSRFVQSGNIISFELGNYDPTASLIIDPWTTMPLMPSANSVFYVKSDGAGNAYLYGGDTPFRLDKYNTSGNLVWTYNTPWSTASHWFGALAVDHAGNSYITNGDGSTLAKIDTGGHLLWSQTSGSAPANLLEFWAIDFNCDQTELFIGGTRDVPLSFDFHGDVFKMDMSNGAITSYVSVVHPSFSITSIGFNEVRTMCSAPNGNLYYCTLDTVGSVTDALSINYGQSSTYTYPYYLPYSNTGGGQGSNSCRANLQYLYTTDGQSLHQRDINTGNVITAVTIPGGSSNNNSGLAIDSCGNVYVGSQNSVVKYTADLTFLTSATTPAAVYDVSIGANGDVLACGNSFAVALAMSACPQMRPICNFAFTATAQPSPISCPGLCNGSATATAVNGTGPFNYSWSPGGETTQTINSLCAGSYTVTITDQSSGTTATATTSIAQPGSFSANAVPTATSCGINNGYAVVHVNAGTGPFSFNWNNGASDSTDHNLGAGTYTVTVTNGAGCTVSAAAVVTSSGGVSITPGATNTSCGSNNGSATVTVTAGTGPYTYDWSNDSITQTISNIGPGTYTVTVTGTGGCTATASATVNSSSNLAFTTSSTASGCTGNGTATVNLTSGSAPFTYSWSNGASTSSIFNIAAGTYLVTVTSGGNCSATGTAAVASSGGGLTLAQSSTGASCGNSDGSAGVTATTGSGPFSYAWSNGGANDTIDNVVTGTYMVTVSGSGGCSASMSILVGVVSNLHATASVAGTSCGKDNGLASLVISTGTGPFTYNWSPSVGGGMTDTISSLPAGTYFVTVTGAGGCTATASAIVNSSNAVALAENSANTSCGNNNGSASVSVTTGISPFSFTWSDSAQTSVISNLASGTYSVTVTDATGCIATASITVNPSSGTPVTINQNNPIMCSGDSSQLCAPTGYVSYAWNEGDNTACIETTLPGNYYVTVTDNGGCTAVSNSLNVAIYPQTAITLTVSGDTLHAYNGVTYQWYYNDTMISGATSPVLIASKNGIYSVVETDSHGCYITSTGQNISTVTGIATVPSATDGIKVYPNPLQAGSWKVDVSEDMIGGVCEIYDAGGRLVYKSEIKDLLSEIDLALAQGVYLMKIYNEHRNVTLKLIRL